MCGENLIEKGGKRPAEMGQRLFFLDRFLVLLEWVG